MQRRRKLEIHSLAVDSFATAQPDAAGGGTVQAHERPCTSWATCDCPTSAYRCSTQPYTAISCPATSLC